ncbi:MAG: ATP-binding cassette domain-containing protein, partial [Treponema sp.]|nr:ATP-binding cassette domain-containing protein [Treponema sp.]
MKRIAIHAEDLSFTYPGASKPALRGLSFDIYEGEHTALLGANGSGKSTLLKCLNGLLRPPSGRISVYGLDPGDESALEGIRRLLGTVLQNPDDQIISSVVEEDVAFGPENLGLRGEELRLRVDKVLDLCDLGALRQRPVRFLSGGERQRLALAGALALDTGGIILDEAVSMLDPAGREAFLKLLERLNGEGKTIIQITHSLEEALRCKRCLVLSGGVLVFDGPPWDLMEREELEEWGFSLPESIRALRLLFASPAAAGDFRVRCLDPEETAEEISRLKGLPEFREKAARFTGPPPARTPTPLRETPPPSAQVPQTLRFEAASHNYLEGTGLAVPAMENVDLEIPSGAGLTVALIGRSGSGKSTVLKHINALLLPGSGRVIVLGEDTLDRRVNLPALRSRVSLSVQNPESALFETYTAD